MKQYQKLYMKKKMVTDKGERRNTLNKVLPIKNTNKNHSSFRRKNHIKYEVPVSIKLLDPGYESKNPYELKEHNFSWINC